MKQLEAEIVQLKSQPEEPTSPADCGPNQIFQGGQCLDIEKEEPEDCAPNQVYQQGKCVDIEEEGSKAFTIKTDQPSYDDGKIIRITGNVGSINESYPNTSITIIITGPTGNIVAIMQVIPDTTGNFSHQVIAGESMTDAGYYTVTAQYGTQKATTTFSFTA